MRKAVLIIDAFSRNIIKIKVKPMMVHQDTGPDILS